MVYKKCTTKSNCTTRSRQPEGSAVADPGFPAGGAKPHGGAPTPDVPTFRFVLFFLVKMKESGPLGGVRRALPDRSASGLLKVR